LLCGLALTGCGGSSSNSAQGPWAAATLPLYSGTGKSVPGLQPVEGFGTGTVKGRVTLRGPGPNLQKLEADLIKQMANHPHGLPCVVGDVPRMGMAWQIDGTGGVANVVVWVQPPEGSFFKIDPGVPWPDQVVIDVPACTFQARAYVLFPSYRDPLSPQRHLATHQLVLLRNSSPFNHSIKWGDGGPNPGGNSHVPPGASLVLPVQPFRDPIRFACAVHPWMTASAWAFDHPFAAVTRPDGTYEIRNVPRGVRLRLLAWHEAVRFVTDDPNGDAIELRDAETVHNFGLQVR
jgi:hypothetical protein